MKRHPAFRAWKTPFDLVKDSLPLALRMATNRVRHLPTTVIVGAKGRDDAALRVYGEASAVLRRGGEGSRLLFEASEADRRLVSVAVSLAAAGCGGRGMCIEASPSYLPTPSALRKMQTVLPNARVIVLLRDPVSRAFSHYQHEKTRHLESRSFAEAVEEEIRANAFPAKCGVALRRMPSRCWGMWRVVTTRCNWSCC